MTIDSSMVQVRLDPAGRIAQDVPCIHCGYNLRSLLPEQACPECNQPVAESLRGDLLRFSNPAWLARLTSGMDWLIIGSALWLVFQVAANPLLQVRQAMGALAITTVILLQQVFIYAVNTAELVGVWKVTWRDPRTMDNPRVPDARTLARVLRIVSFVLLLIPWSPPGPLSVMLVLLWLVPRTIWLLGCICLYIHVARLARRVPAMGLVRLTYIAVAAMTLDYFLLNGYSLWNAWTMPTGPAGATSSPWRILLLISHYLSLTYLILFLIAQFLYRRRFRRALHQSQASIQQPSA